MTVDGKCLLMVEVSDGSWSWRSFKCTSGDSKLFGSCWAHDPWIRFWSSTLQSEQVLVSLFLQRLRFALCSRVSCIAFRANLRSCEGSALRDSARMVTESSHIILILHYMSVWLLQRVSSSCVQDLPVGPCWTATVGQNFFLRLLLADSVWSPASATVESADVSNWHCLSCYLHGDSYIEGGYWWQV